MIIQFQAGLPMILAVKFTIIETNPCIYVSEIHYQFKNEVSYLLGW